ncbi:MAG: hypothetical protein LBD13_03820 [Spirochaetaceae bacterium]|jgi:hypothetical protein|nr:hypothetical protein [Spirochaetaceae bacterium]
MTRKRLFFLFFMLPALVFGQEESALPEDDALKQEIIEPQEGAPEAAEAEAPPQEKAGLESALFTIRAVDFNVTGRSRPSSLMYHGEFAIGEKIPGKDALDRYITAKTQLLSNQRVLETVAIDYTLGEPDSKGLVPVDLLVTVKDTWNIIALPYPKFDSNSGFELIIKARDYNFLGLMTPLRIDLGYEHKEGSSVVGSVKDVFKAEIDTNTPFKAFGFNWNIDFDHFFSYTLEDGDGLLAYKNVSGLSLEIPVERTTLTIGFEQDFILHEENPERYKQDYGGFAEFFTSSALRIAWKIPLGVHIDRFGELAYTPSVSESISYRPGRDIEFWRKGPGVTLSHSLGFGRINWIGNYRSGLEASVSNSNTYNFYRAGWNSEYGIFVAGHKIAARFLGISGRFRFQQWFFDQTYSTGAYPDYVEAGGVLRGILDRSVIVKHGGYMFSLNLDFPFHVLNFAPSAWFKTRKLRFFDFDMHLSLFMDTALLKGSKASWGGGGELEEEEPIPFIPFSTNGTLTGIGLEVIVFPAFMRSFYVRASLGYNLNKFLETHDIPKWDELFIGIGHHY